MSRIRKHQYSVLDLVTLVESLDRHAIDKRKIVNLIIEQMNKTEDLIDSELDEAMDDNANDDIEKSDTSKTTDDIVDSLKQDLRTIFGTDDIDKLDKVFLQNQETDAYTDSDDYEFDNESEEQQEDEQYEQIAVDLTKLRLLDRLKFLLSTLPKLELIILALPTHISKNEPLIFVYLLDKLTDLQYLIKYLIARVDEYDVDSLELIVSELEDFIADLVETARDAYYGSK